MRFGEDLPPTMTELRARTGRRRAVDVGLPPHDVRVGVAPRRVGRRSASSSAPASRWPGCSPTRRKPFHTSPASVWPTAARASQRSGRRRRGPSQHAARVVGPRSGQRRSRKRSTTPASSTSAASIGCVDGAAYPPRTGPIGGDLGYLKYGVFVGDNRTFSVTLATPTDDEELRKLLSRSRRVRCVCPPTGGHRAVARRARRADHRIGPRHGRADQPVAGLRRRRPSRGDRFHPHRRCGAVHQPALRPRVLAPRSGAHI